MLDLTPYSYSKIELVLDSTKKEVISGNWLYKNDIKNNNIKYFYQTIINKYYILNKNFYAVMTAIHKIIPITEIYAIQNKRNFIIAIGLDNEMFYDILMKVKLNLENENWF